MDFIYSLFSGASHSFVQLAVAVPVGVASDFAFHRAFLVADGALHAATGTLTYAERAAEELSRELDSDAALVSDVVRLAVQIVGSGLFLTTAVAYLSSLPLESSDPAAGSVFIWALFAAQSRLNLRVARIVRYVNRRFMSIETGIEHQVKDTMGWKRGSKAKQVGAPEGARQQTERARRANIAGDVQSVF